MNPNLKALIFDFDGLLMDSEPIWDEAYSKFLVKHDVRDNSKYWDLMTGRGLKEVIELMKNKMGLEGETISLVRDYQSVFDDLYRKSKDKLLLDGVEDLLKQLNKQGIRPAVATGGHTKKMTSKMLSDLALLGYFDVIASSDDVKNGKPAPDVFLEVAKQLGLAPSECLVCEDSVNGIVAAKAAGMFAIGISKDEDVREKLKEAKADQVYSSLKKVEVGL